MSPDAPARALRGGEFADNVACARSPSTRAPPRLEKRRRQSLYASHAINSINKTSLVDVIAKTVWRNSDQIENNWEDNETRETASDWVPGNSCWLFKCECPLCTLSDLTGHYPGRAGRAVTVRERATKASYIAHSRGLADFV